MERKAQGSMEYLMTYGWAILVILVIGVAMWQMGLFSPAATVVTNFSGFSPLKPIEQYCVVGTGASDTVTVVMNNAAGRTIRNLTISVFDNEPTACDSLIAMTGKKFRCFQTNIDCGADKPGERYDVDLSIGYDSLSGERRASSGTVWGPAE